MNISQCKTKQRKIYELFAQVLLIDYICVGIRIRLMTLDRDLVQDEAGMLPGKFFLAIRFRVTESKPDLILLYE